MAGAAGHAVLFDVDGVLLDSLPQHLQICKDKAREYGLGHLSIPSVDEFRDLVSRGTRVSPTLYFFLAVGFPKAAAQRAVDDYEREFMQRYQSQSGGRHSTRSREVRARAG